MTTEIQKIVNKNRLSISRIDAWAKQAFLDRAEKEFCNDYGQCLMSMIKECAEYNSLKGLFFSGELKSADVGTAIEENEIKFGDGRKKCQN